MIPEIVSQLIQNENICIHQSTRINKVYEEEYYVLDQNIDETKINIFISGSSKSVYTISINKLESESGSGKIWCNCPDNKSHAARHNCICKHCCFVLLKIGRIYDIDCIKNKRLSTSQQNQVVTRLSKVLNRNNSVEVNEEVDEEELINKELQLKYLSLTSSTKEDTKGEEKKEEEKKCCTKFDKNDKEIEEDEECPICFDYLKEGEVKSCPDCKNFVHYACIQKWLTTKDTCVLCRSTVWKTFLKEHFIDKKEVQKKSKAKNSDYLQL